MVMILDLVDPQELQGFVRGIQIEEERNRFTLSAYLPNDMIDEIEYRITQGDLVDTDAAQIRAWDTESGIGSRQGAARLMGEMPPISRKIRLGEEERLRKRALERSNNTQLIDAIYNDARNMARAVLARIEMLRGEALFTGKVVINENGVKQTVDFGRSAGHSVTAATLWSDTANATPVANLRAWVQTYIDDNGVAPALALTSTAVISNLMLNAEIRALAANLTGTPSIVTLATVNAVFSAFGLPPFVPNDTQVRVQGAKTRVTPVGDLLLLPPAGEPLGATFFGTTAESLELVDAQAIAQDQAPGLISTIHRLDDPVSTWTKVAAVSFPGLANPDLTFRATVQ